MENSEKIVNSEEETLPEVKSRGKIEYPDRRGMMHYFDDEAELEEFLASENSRDNK